MTKTDLKTLIEQSHFLGADSAFWLEQLSKMTPAQQKKLAAILTAAANDHWNESMEKFVHSAGKQLENYLDEHPDALPLF